MSTMHFLYISCLFVTGKRQITTKGSEKSPTLKNTSQVIVKAFSFLFPSSVLGRLKCSKMRAAGCVKICQRGVKTVIRQTSPWAFVNRRAMSTSKFGTGEKWENFHGQTFLLGCCWLNFALIKQYLFGISSLYVQNAHFAWQWARILVSYFA